MMRSTWYTSSSSAINLQTGGRRGFRNGPRFCLESIRNREAMGLPRFGPGLGGMGRGSSVRKCSFCTHSSAKGGWAAQRVGDGRAAGRDGIGRWARASDSSVRAPGAEGVKAREHSRRDISTPARV
eukprot:2123841-Prymnesium_polylepis.1